MITSLTLSLRQPQRPRALRVHDENMPPPSLNGVALGKTLHQRTKSTPALSSLLQADAIKAVNKKVLGEVNANIRLAQVVRDDSEIGKASPGKISLVQEPMKPAAAVLARPATRPLAQKSLSAQNMPARTTTATATTITKSQVVDNVTSGDQEPVKKVVAKKSTKVLKDVLQPEAVSSNQVPIAPVHQSLAPPRQAAEPAVAQSHLVDTSLGNGIAVQHQEVRKTESVPLRDEPAPRLTTKPSNLSTLPPTVVPEQGPMPFLDSHAAQVQLQQANGFHMPNSQQHYALANQPPAEQLYDAVEDDEYYFEDGYTTARSFGARGESTGGITTVLAPKCTERVQRELDDARAFVEATRSPEDVEDEQWDTSMVAEYGDEIFQYMRDLETRMAPNPRYMEQQQEIQWSMRAVLMDWVIQVHQRFNLLPETLFLTVNYIDRFLSCKIVSLGKLQLVGATAIFVAAKYEEVQCPTIAEIIYMVDGGYSPDELLKAERFMLSMLQFELGWPGPMSFLRRISKADDYDLETRTLAKYFLEVTIMDERFVSCTPSFLAAGAHCMARLMLRKGDWSPAHVFYSGYTYTQLRQLLGAMLECCEDPQKHHSAVFDKYVDKRYKRASTFVAGEMQKGFQLPITTRGSSMGPLDGQAGRIW